MWSATAQPPVIDADPAPRRLGVDPEIVGDGADRRSRPGSVQRDRLSLEFRAGLGVEVLAGDR
jgi:hypothetical protein